MNLTRLVWFLLGCVVMAAVAILVLVYRRTLVAVGKTAITRFNRPVKGARKDVIDYEIKVVGVTFNGRQDIIKNLSTNAKLVYKFVDGCVDEAGTKYPNAVGVFAEFSDGSLVQVGWVPDSRGAHRSSMALMFRDKVRKDKAPEIRSWNKVGGKLGLKWGLRLQIRNPR